MKRVLLLLALTFLLLLISPLVFGKSEKVTICHATGSDTNPYVRIVVSENAIFAHFENPGSPLAGHEDDILYEGEVPCPNGDNPISPTLIPTSPITPTNGLTPTSQPTSGLTPTQGPSATPVHPSATPGPGPSVTPTPSIVVPKEAARTGRGE